jgi:hypothetical protein
MKKILLSIVILFSIAMYSQDQSEKLRGTWSSPQTSYYVVILHDETKGYEFINFSFAENKSLKEIVVEENKNFIKTKLVNPDENYKVFITYRLIDDVLYCEFEGDSNHITKYTKHYIMKN